jgi:hypothetical protein
MKSKSTGHESKQWRENDGGSRSGFEKSRDLRERLNEDKRDDRGEHQGSSNKGPGEKRFSGGDAKDNTDSAHQRLN